TFHARQTSGGPGARGKQHLVIGPWRHGGPGSDAQPRPAGELLFPANSRTLPVPLGAAEWFEHHLRGRDTGADRAPTVLYYTMGAVDEAGAPGNVWHTADAWPPPAERTAFHLTADGDLSTTPPDDHGTRTFLADPHRPVPTRGGGNLSLDAGPF